MKTRCVGLAVIALLAGCKSTQLQPLDVKGFPSWQQIRSSVMRTVPRLKVPTKAKQGVDDTVYADLTYRWVEGQAWDLTVRSTFHMRSGGAGGVDGSDVAVVTTEQEVRGDEHYRYTVLGVDEAGTARIEERLISVRAEILPPSDQPADVPETMGGGTRTLDSETGEVTGTVTVDAQARRIEAPLIVVVESNGHVRAVEQADALRGVMLEGLEGNDREDVAKTLTDPELIGNAQGRFMILPAARVHPGKRWTAKVPASRPGTSLLKNIEVVSEYLGTVQINGATCAKVYTQRVIPGERDEMGESKSLVSAVVLKQGFCLRLEDQRVVQSDGTTLRVNSLVGTVDESLDTPVQTTIAMTWKVLTEVEYSVPPE